MTTRLRDMALAITFGVMLSLFLMASADSHALLKSSEPANGARLESPPNHIVLHFTEAPDIKLSAVKVLDATGKEYQAGPASTLPSDPSALKVGVSGLSKGIYTVSWRVLSQVDGHLTAGAFAFGIGVQAPTNQTITPEVGASISPVGITGRWIFYIGVVTLIGFGWFSGSVFTFPSVGRWIGMSLLLGILGAAVVTTSQVFDSRVAVLGFLTTRLGRSDILRMAPLMLGALILSIVRPGKQTRWKGWVAMGVGLAAVAFHSLAGHASASPIPVLAVSAQFLHISAASLWMGGLAALLIATRGEPDEKKAKAASKFSGLASLMIFIVAGTGLYRALVEVATFRNLLTTNYGKSVVAKGALLVLLATLGAVNRFRNVPAARQSLKALRRIGNLEIVTAFMTLGVTAFLSSNVPGRDLVSRTAGAQKVMLEASDFGTTVMARLSIYPGLPGVNLFRANIRDFDTGRPITPRRANIRFEFRSDPNLGNTSLALSSKTKGVFEGTGPNLSLDGRWGLTLLLESASTSTQVEYFFSTLRRGQTETINAEKGQPTLHNLQLATGESLQLYLDPEVPGPSTLHLTFFDSSGNELPIGAVSALGGRPGTKGEFIPVRRFSPGHFVAERQISKGTLIYDITAQTSAAKLRFLALVTIE